MAPIAGVNSYYSPGQCFPTPVLKYPQQHNLLLYPRPSTPDSTDHQALNELNQVSVSRTTAKMGAVGGRLGLEWGNTDLGGIMR